MRLVGGFDPAFLACPTPCMIVQKFPTLSIAPRRNTYKIYEFHLWDIQIKRIKLIRLPIFSINQNKV